MSDKKQRQQNVLALLARNRIDSQDQLLDLLLAEGVRTTQSTLSRDLRELGIVKSPSGYRRPEVDAARPALLDDLARQIRRKLLRIDVGGNIVVLRTEIPEEAVEVAGQIDRSAVHQAISSLAIGDTVLVIARTPAYARDVARALRKA